jgi:predicted nucleotidyltransferase
VAARRALEERARRRAPAYDQAVDHDSEIARIIERHEAIAAAWLIGSVARGDARPESDLDVAILLRPGAAEDQDDLLRLSIDLERFSPSGRVDVVVLGPQGPVFRHRVLREGRLLVDRDAAARHELEERTIVEYLDWKPTHDIAMRSTWEGLRRRLGGAAR